MTIRHAPVLEHPVSAVRTGRPAGAAPARDAAARPIGELPSHATGGQAA